MPRLEVETAEYAPKAGERGLDIPEGACGLRHP